MRCGVVQCTITCDAVRLCHFASGAVWFLWFGEHPLVSNACMIKLEVPSDEDYWLVFSKIAFSDKNYEECKQLQEIGMQIVKKCKGLPPALQRD